MNEQKPATAQYSQYSSSLPPGAKRKKERKKEASISLSIIKVSPFVFKVPNEIYLHAALMNRPRES